MYDFFFFFFFFIVVVIADHLLDCVQLKGGANNVYKIFKLTLKFNRKAQSLF